MLEHLLITSDSESHPVNKYQEGEIVLLMAKPNRRPGKQNSFHITCLASSSSYQVLSLCLVLTHNSVNFTLDLDTYKLPRHELFLMVHHTGGTFTLCY